jgi:hypothetical protein
MFPILWKQAAVVPVFKTGNSAIVTNYRPITIVNNFSKIVLSIIYDQVSFYFKRKLNYSQHDFIKRQSTATNLLT